MTTIQAPMKKLTHYLTSPSKIASTLDWRKLTGSVLSLDITSSKIELTLSSHPLSNKAPVKLDPIPLVFDRSRGRKYLRETTSRQIYNLCMDKGVCSFVVGWPVQKEGRLGASCGRVLFTLDSLLQSNLPIFTDGRKFCLWDGLHTELEHDDAFGRSTSFGGGSKCDADFVHLASKEQYSRKTPAVGDIWDDFSRIHWPELHKDETPAYTPEECSSSEYHNGEWLEQYEREGGGHLHAESL